MFEAEVAGEQLVIDAIDVADAPFGVAGAPPHVPHLRPGAKLGGYQLISRVGWGGMAEIYLARSIGRRDLDERVVLKRMLPSLDEKPSNVRLFLNEARLCATFDHPNLVRVREIGDLPGNYFYAMEHVDGHDLLAVLRRACVGGSALPIEQAVRIAIAVAAGLDYAHNHCAGDGQPLSIVHRDVSPSNVMLGRDGTVKLLDFGIAKADVDDTHVKTERGAVRGKLCYLSPEQCLSLPVDRRADVFALGILLYEMTVGQRLFQRESVLATVDQITLTDAPSPRQAKPQYPEALERIVRRALERDVERRYQSAGDLLRDLEEFAHASRFDAYQGLDLYLDELFGPHEVPTERELFAFDRGSSTVAQLAAIAELRTRPVMTPMGCPVVLFTDPVAMVESFESESTDVDAHPPALPSLVASSVPAAPLPQLPPPAFAASDATAASDAAPDLGPPPARLLYQTLEPRPRSWRLQLGAALGAVALAGTLFMVGVAKPPVVVVVAPPVAVAPLVANPAAAVAPVATAPAAALAKQLSARPPRSKRVAKKHAHKRTARFASR